MCYWSSSYCLHLKGFQALGAKIDIKHGYVYAKAPNGLKGADIYLGGSYGSSVLATANVMMAAVSAKGRTSIESAACEPDVVDLAQYLKKMGARTSGEGSPHIEIEGVKKLNGVAHTIIPDRIETGTYIFAAAMTGGKVTARGISREKLRGVLEVLEESGCSVVSTDNALTLSAPDRLKAVSFVTNPYPGVASDVQPLLMAAMAKASGHCTVEERVFESRFGHVAEYRRLGAEISINQRVASITGVDELTGAPVEGLDIRAVAGLVLMGLAAKGVTEVSGIHHLDRGYGFFVEKLKALGAQVSRVPVYESREIVVGC